jgi:hypothetical protein
MGLIEEGNITMIAKISALARIANTLLAVAAGIFVIPGLDGATLTTTLIVIGLVAGLTYREGNQLMFLAIAAIVLPLLSGVLSGFPGIGPQLSAIATNLGIGIAGGVVSAVSLSIYDTIRKDVATVAGK